ncbi:CoA-binding protein [Cellulomonas endophytica]|uniref:CoA-binding protein n=1 Tax=Cellulomonas endophytica TaxID=2494735 RepID=UPI0010136ED0|nr:CoA-binding protein [Cellulomonas endophytica]
MSDDLVRRLLSTPGRWAVVGLGDTPSRPAWGVARYLQELGHEIVPVHPRAETVHGARGYASLADVPGPVDVVDVFVANARVGGVVDAAIAVGAPAVWLQLDVHDAEAEERARAAGLDLVTDRCPAIEGRRLGLPGPA